MNIPLITVTRDLIASILLAAANKIGSGIWEDEDGE